jgi:hypothetical protein
MREAHNCRVALDLLRSDGHAPMDPFCTPTSSHAHAPCVSLIARWMRCLQSRYRLPKRDEMGEIPRGVQKGRVSGA